MPYSDLFKEHLARPRNAGELADADAAAEQTNPACGSALASLLEGLTLEEAARLTRAQVAAAAGGLPARKQHAAALAVETLRAALGQCGVSF